MAKKKKRRRAKGKGKGGSFERKMSVTLSEWWTEGKRKDVFWRTAGSGSRATVRGRRGHRTHGSYGDLAAVDPIGEPLIDVAVISLKTGYSSVNLLTAIDKKDQTKKTEFEKWVEEAKEQHEFAGSLGWLLVHQRKGRAAVIHVSETLHPFLAASLVLCKCVSIKSVFTGVIFAYRLDDFLDAVHPDTIKRLSKRA